MNNTQPATRNPQPFPRPQKSIVPLAEALGWRAGGDYLFQVKKDGVFSTRNLELGTRNYLLAGELVRRKSGGFLTFQDTKILEAHGEIFWAHTLLAVDGQDVSRRPLRETHPELKGLFRVPSSDFRGTEDQAGSADATRNTQHATLRLMPEFSGGEGLEAALASGEEGGVAKSWSHGYGHLYAAVLLETYYCVVTGLAGAAQSVEVARIEDGRWQMADGTPSSILYSPSSPRTRLPLFGGKCDRVRVGSVLKVLGKRLTAAGCIREPRVCTDTPESWLVKY